MEHPRSSSDSVMWKWGWFSAYACRSTHKHINIHRLISNQVDAGAHLSQGYFQTNMDPDRLKRITFCHRHVAIIKDRMCLYLCNKNTVRSQSPRWGKPLTVIEWSSNPQNVHIDLQVGWKLTSDEQSQQWDFRGDCTSHSLQSQGA